MVAGLGLKRTHGALTPLPWRPRYSMKIAYLSNCLADLHMRKHLLSEIVQRGHTIAACVAAARAERRTPRPQHINDLALLSLSRTATDPLGDLRYILQVRKFLRKHKPDIVLNRALKPAIYGSLAARMAGINRTFSLICGLGFAFGGETPRRRALSIFVSGLCRISLSRNTAVFFQNPDDRKLFCDRRLIRTDQAALVNGSGVDLDEFPFSPPVTDGPVYILVSRLVRSKGVIEFLEAAGVLKKKYPSARFLLVGPPDYGPDRLDHLLLRKCADSGLVEVCGEVMDVRPFIRRASIFVLPSYYREGVPRATLEAMAMGRPVITADTPGCRETVLHGENGFLVPPKDAWHLGQAMERFIKEPGLIASMGERSREIVSSKFRVDEVNRIILARMGVPDVMRKSCLAVE